MIPKTKLLRGIDIKINENLTIKNHTIGEIIDFGENDYWNAVSTFVTRPYDYRVILYDSGIDYRTLTNFQMFIYLYKKNAEQIKFLLGDYNFEAGIDKKTNELKMIDVKKKVKLDEKIYNLISYYLKTINCIEQDKIRLPANDSVYRQLMKEELKRYKRRLNKLQNKSEEDSDFRKYISFLAWCNSVGVNIFNIWDLTIYQFFDGIKTVLNQKETNDLRRGVYSGSIDVEKIDKSLLNYIR